MATAGLAVSGHNYDGSCGILVLMWRLGHSFSSHYNQLALISVDIISGVYCNCFHCHLITAAGLESSYGLVMFWEARKIFTTEVFGSTGFGNNGFSGVTDILAIPKLKFYIKNVHSNGFPGITDKMAIRAHPELSVTSENLCNTLKNHTVLVNDRVSAHSRLGSVKSSPSRANIKCNVFNYRGFRKYRIWKYRIFGNNGHFGNPQLEILH